MPASREHAPFEPAQNPVESGPREVNVEEVTVASMRSPMQVESRPMTKEEREEEEYRERMSEQLSRLVKDHGMDEAANIVMATDDMRQIMLFQDVYENTYHKEVRDALRSKVLELFYRDNPQLKPQA